VAPHVQREASEVTRMPPAAPSAAVVSLLAALSGCQPDPYAPDRDPGIDDPIPADDTEAPRVVLTEPVAPAILDGDRIVIAGRVEDDNPDRLEIDGVPVDLDADGTFSVALPVEPGAVRARVRAYDTAGHAGEAFVAALVGPQRPSGTPIEDAAALGLAPGAFAELARGAEALLAGADLGATMAGGAPILEGSWGELTVVGLTHGAVDVALAPADGVIESTVTVAAPRVDLELDPPIFGTVTGFMAADTLLLSVALALTPADGRATVSEVAATVELEGFRYNVDGFPGFVEDLVRDYVRSYVEQQIGRTVASLLRTYVEDALASLPQSFEAPVLGAPVEIRADVSAIEVTPAGARLVIDLSGMAVSPLPERAAFGHLAAPEAALPAGSEHDVELAFAVQSLNAFMSELWRGGGRIDRITTPPTAGEIALLVPSWRDDAPSDARIDVVLDFALPPVVVGDEHDGLRMETADLRIDVIAVAGGEDVHLGTASAAVSADVDVLLDESTGAPVVRLEIGETRVSGDGLTGLDGVAGQRIDEILSALAPPIADFLERFLALSAPAMAGFRLDAESAGPRDGYVRLGGRLAFEGSAP
jgi:hypothetical protein